MSSPLPAGPVDPLNDEVTVLNRRDLGKREGVDHFWPCGFQGGHLVDTHAAPHPGGGGLVIAGSQSVSWEGGMLFVGVEPCFRGYEEVGTMQIKEGKHLDMSISKSGGGIDGTGIDVHELELIDFF